VAFKDSGVSSSFTLVSSAKRGSRAQIRVDSLYQLKVRTYLRRYSTLGFGWHISNYSLHSVLKGFRACLPVVA
jgi:hypothetical protein